MPRLIYETIRTELIEYEPFFRQQRHATSMQGATADAKMTAALRMPTEARSAFSLVEFLRFSEPLILKSMKRFCRCIVALYEDEWLRSPHLADLSNIEARYSSLGIPGCIGS